MEHRTIRACSIWRALDVVGDVPVLLILEQAFLGRRHFQDFVAGTGIARSVVSNRLARLVDAGVLQPADSKRDGYRLTEKGRGLFGVALMILRWQHHWEAGERAYQARLVHRECGHPTVPVARCRACGGTIDPRQVGWSPGPGLSRVLPVYSRRRRQTAAASAKRGNKVMVDTVIELFGDRWSTLIVRACFTGINRFDAIQRDTLMATNMLSDRLARLETQGILKASLYSAHQDRFEYKLTAKGRDLYPVLLALLEWGDRWYADAAGPPLLLTHLPCGQSLALQTACSECDGALHVGNIAFDYVASG